MAFIDWNEQLSVNIATIDSQHKQLVLLINQLHDAMIEKKTKDALVTIANKMVSYTITHFSTEERYFTQYNYPGFATHIAEHESFKAKATEFQNKLKDGRLVLSLEVMNFLKDWLSHHILQVDKQYSSFLVAKGVK